MKSEDSAADKHTLQVCHLMEAVSCITRKGLSSRRTFILTLSIHRGCTVHYTTKDSGADKHLF